MPAPFLTVPLAAASVLLVSACQPAARAPDQPPAADPTREPILASDLLLRKVTANLDFRWSAPPEAALEPKLFRQLRSDGEKALADAELAAKSAADDAKTGDYPFYGHEYVERWSAGAETPGLLALSAEVYNYTGGAHGNMGYDAVLFDRATGKVIRFADLFTDADAALKALTPAWCKGLDEERARKRDGRKLSGEFSECPALAEQTILPVGEGRVDHLLVMADPYIAGPWAEGGYQVGLPTESVRSLLKTAYVRDFTPS